MFREMRRMPQALTKEECIKVLKEEKRGVLSVIGDNGYPYGLPHRVDAMRACNKASFCVYKNVGNDPDSWVLNFHSVHVFGTIELIEDIDEIEKICRDISHKFTDDEAYIDDEVKSALKATLCFAITIENMTGKKIHET